MGITTTGTANADAAAATSPTGAVTGLDFVGIQVRDVEASARFYTDQLGLRRAPMDRPDAVVFDATPIPFAVRTPLPGVDLDTLAQPGAGIALWLSSPDPDALADRLAASGTRIVAPVSDGPFGRQFTFVDPDGYAIVVHGEG